MWFQPFRVVAQRTTFAQVVVHTVAFDVCFIVYIESVFVAEFVETAVLRVVAEADGIDVMAFHQFEILPHQFFRDIVAGFRIVFVDIDSTELDGLSVHQQYHVILTVSGFLVDFLDFDAAESYVIRNHFGHFSVFLHGHEEFVQVRCFGSPGLYIRQLLLEVDGTQLVRRNADGLFAFADGFSIFVYQCIGYGQIGGVGLVIFQVDGQPENTVLIGIVQGRSDTEIVDRRFGLGIQEDIAFDTAHAPEILTFQVRTCTPTENLQGQHILSWLEIIVDEVFCRILGVFVIADFFSVYVDITARFGSGYVQVDVTSVPIGRNGDFTAIHTYRILFRQSRRLGITGLEFVAVVGVDGCSEALYFPVSGNLNIFPFVQAGGTRNVFRQLFVGVYVIEFPGTV